VAVFDPYVRPVDHHDGWIFVYGDQRPTLFSKESAALDFPFLSLIIPAHNEEKRLPYALGQAFTFLEKQAYTSEVILVENASSDHTLEVAQKVAQNHPNLLVLHLDLPGKGRAVRHGMLEALGSYRFFADVDFSMPVEQINRFIPPACESVIAIASREVRGAIRYNEPPYRHFTGRIFNFFIRLLVIPEVQDTQCGFKCFRADVAEDLFRFQTLQGWSFDVELLAIAHRRGYMIKEIGIPWYFNADSKVRVFRDSLRMFIDLLTIRANLRRGNYDP
jgi:glycosyltransferase involved in cell wall biosynthesis